MAANSQQMECFLNAGDVSVPYGGTEKNRGLGDASKYVSCRANYQRGVLPSFCCPAIHSGISLSPPMVQKILQSISYVRN